VAEIGLFPLELVLVPTERVPLHIFEPRYRELIGECVDEEREFGLVLEDSDGMRTIGTSTAVVEVTERFDDGRFNIVAEGRTRFRVVELTEGRSFVTAEVEPIEDDQEEAPTQQDVERALGRFRRLVEIADAEEVDEPAPDSPLLSFELAARVDFGRLMKQELLEARSERERLRQLVRLLDRAAAAITREREVRTRASGNGRVTPSS
jgi:ATP-dependent Lon protease